MKAPSFEKKSKRLIRLASKEARSLGHSYVGGEHLLLAMVEQEGTLPCQVLQRSGLNRTVLRALIEPLFGCGTPGLPLPQGLNQESRQILRRARWEARQTGYRHILPSHMLLALVRQPNGCAKELLELSGLAPDDVFAQTLYHMNRCEPVKDKEKGRAESMKLLEQFSEDLLEKAATLDPVVGREKELEAVIGILSRKNKNNPALIGEPGVGKTAIAEALAQRMVSGNVPLSLKGKRLLSLNMANLVAGTKYRGEFEERVRDLLLEIRRAGNIILFVDEMHTIIGAGAAEGAIDAANILKPALGRGELQMLGATTLDEYRKHIEKDPALERRFRPVLVEEPNRETCLSILQSLRGGLERHHHIKITEEALEAAVDLSTRYLPDRFLPDKAIDLLDEGAARAHMEELQKDKGGIESEKVSLELELRDAVQNSRFEKAAELRDKMQKILSRSQDGWRNKGVTARDIAKAVSAQTGIPVGSLAMEERQKLLGLEDRLNQEVLGQKEAVAAVTAAVRRGRSGLADHNRPTACLLFTGPTGVGKTELCRVLAETIFGSRNAMIRFDMTEFMEKQSVSRLIGAPPGYVGHEEGGMLTEKVRRKPYSLVLFDELEKAHPDVVGILLQIMEDGILTDSLGRTVSFKNTIIVMTSNLGGDKRDGEGLGFLPPSQEAQVGRCLQERFTPEFLGRIDKVAIFRPLGREALEAIARKQLEQLQKRGENSGLRLRFSPALAHYMVETTGAGARQIRRNVRERLENPLTQFLLWNPPGNKVLCANWNPETNQPEFHLERK